MTFSRIALTMLVKSHPFNIMTSAIITYAMGDRKKERSSLMKRMKKVRMKKIDYSILIQVLVFSFTISTKASSSEAL